MAPAEVQAYAASRVSGPALALIITAGIDLGIGVIGTIANLVSTAYQDFGQMPGFRGQPDMAQMNMFGGAMAIFSGIVGVILAIVIIMGAVKMRNLENYGLAMTAAVIAVIPCFHGCCILTLPFGIWALMALSDGYVRAAFQTSTMQ